MRFVLPNFALEPQLSHSCADFPTLPCKACALPVREEVRPRKVRGKKKLQKVTPVGVTSVSIGDESRIGA